MYDIDKSWKLLEDISFVRVGGTDEELRAAHIIQDALKELGLDSHLEDFDQQSSVVDEVSLEVLEPYHKEYPCTAYIGSTNTPEEGLEADVVFYEGNNPVSNKLAKGKIVMVEGSGCRNIIASFNADPVGFISYSGDINQKAEDTDLDQKEYRISVHKAGEIPGVHIKMHDAMEMCQKGASRVRMKLKQTNGITPSRNVVCEIPGEIEDEVIICSAHYDSVPFSKGPYDNGTGSVTLYSLAQHYAAHKPVRTIRLVWCGSEERGLCGSLAYVEQHKNDLDNVVLNINIDMLGAAMGKTMAIAAAEPSLASFADYDAKLAGYPLMVKSGAGSTDSSAFAGAGIPAITFGRMTERGAGTIHSRLDLIDRLSKEQLKKDMDYVVSFTDRIGGGYVMPVKREIPEDIKKELTTLFEYIKGVDKEEKQ